MSFLDIVSKFNQQADSHSKSQSLNPFSEQFEQSRSPSPRFSREEYGKPVAGSKTDLRGRKAKSHICREILELCTVIHDVGTYKAKKREPDSDDDSDREDDGTIIVSFGELFQIYTKISDKVVGLLIAAKRRGFVYFDREILFQRRDDDVLIALMKPISEINKILKDDISQASAPTPVEPTPEKKKSTSSSKTKRVKSAPVKNQNVATTTACATAATAPGDQANGVSVNGEGVDAETGGKGPDDNDEVGDQNISVCSDGVVNDEEANAKTVESVVEGDGDQIVSSNSEVVNGEDVDGEEVNGEEVNGEEVNGEKVNGEEVNCEEVKGEEVNGEKVNVEEEVVSEIKINVIDDETVCNGDASAETVEDEIVEVSVCKEDEIVPMNVSVVDGGAETTGPLSFGGVTGSEVENHESVEAAGEVGPVETANEKRIDVDAISAEGSSDRVETPNESDAKEVSDSGGGVININKVTEEHRDVVSSSPAED